MDLLFGYTGQEWDATVELAYYSDGGGSGRWYDPGVGRFLSEDPIRDDRQNLYRYVGNNAVNATDPSGLAKNNLGGGSSYNNNPMGGFVPVWGANGTMTGVAPAGSQPAVNINSIDLKNVGINYNAATGSVGFNIPGVNYPAGGSSGAMGNTTVNFNSAPPWTGHSQASTPWAPAHTPPQPVSMWVPPVAYNPAPAHVPSPVSMTFGGGMGMAPVVMPNIATQVMAAVTPQPTLQLFSPPNKESYPGFKPFYNIDDLKAQQLANAQLKPSTPAGTFTDEFGVTRWGNGPHATVASSGGIAGLFNEGGGNSLPVLLQSGHVPFAAVAQPLMTATASSVTHAMLDYVGMFDPTGIADGINAGIYTFQGDTRNAGISLAAIVVGGDFAKPMRYAPDLGGAFGGAARNTPPPKMPSVTPGVTNYVPIPAPLPILNPHFTPAQMLSPVASTGNLRNNLGQIYTQAGLTIPQGAAAHHIVPAAHPDALLTRIHLESLGIDIHSPANGVFLPQTTTSTAIGAYHPSLHTNDYIGAVNTLIQATPTQADALHVLQQIRGNLSMGILPQQTLGK
ncbi:MAG: AHH domain-containing protein [Pirellulales bacterium]|nr:AHH domain-containing protein [Pirellulales bacterium]